MGFIFQHDKDKKRYKEGGIKLTEIFNSLKSRYFEVQSKSGNELDVEVKNWELESALS